MEGRRGGDDFDFVFSFFFWCFFSLFLVNAFLVGDGIRFSNPGGNKGPEIDVEEMELALGFLRGAYLFCKGNGEVIFSVGSGDVHKGRFCAVFFGGLTWQIWRGEVAEHSAGDAGLHVGIWPFFICEVGLVCLKISLVIGGLGGVIGICAANGVEVVEVFNSFVG